MKNAIIILLFTAFPSFVFGQDKASEAEFYELKTLPIPANIELEIGGMATIPDGRVAVSTRRGEVWMVENPYSVTPYYRLFAKGMHEVLGLTYHKGALYAVQRGELTKLIDNDGDGEADNRRKQRVRGIVDDRPAPLPEGLGDVDRGRQHEHRDLEGHDRDLPEHQQEQHETPGQGIIVDALA